MLLATETVTVVNRYTTNGAPVYQCHVIQGCSWKRTHGKDAHDVIRIPQNTKGATGYVTPEMWAELRAGNHSIVWTLQEGDLVCRGALRSVTPGAANSLARKRDTLRITKVRDNRRGLNPHWAVEGAV